MNKVRIYSPLEVSFKCLKFPLIFATTSFIIELGRIAITLGRIREDNIALKHNDGAPIIHTKHDGTVIRISIKWVQLSKL